MNLQDLRTMLDYHYWARDRLLEAIDALTPDQLTRDLGSSFKSVRDTVAHTYAAEWAWYQRWLGQSPKALLPYDQFPDVASIRNARDFDSEIRKVLLMFASNRVRDTVCMVFFPRLP